MKTFRVVALAAALIAPGLGLHASDALRDIVESYLTIQARLAADDLAGVKEPARAIAPRAASMGTAGPAIARAAAALQTAADLNSARTAFGELSDAVIAAGNAEGWKDVPGVRLGFCSMANRSWLQRDKQVRNPYYGASMLTCGELKALPK